MTRYSILEHACDFMVVWHVRILVFGVLYGCGNFVVDLVGKLI